MSEQEIDARRAFVIAGRSPRCRLDDDSSNRVCIGLAENCNCLSTARAIRLSDEAAGCITARLEGVVNEKDRKG